MQARGQKKCFFLIFFDFYDFFCECVCICAYFLVFAPTHTRTHIDPNGRPSFGRNSPKKPCGCGDEVCGSTRPLFHHPIAPYTTLFLRYTPPYFALYTPIWRALPPPFRARQMMPPCQPGAAADGMGSEPRERKGEGVAQAFGGRRRGGAGG